MGSVTGLIVVIILGLLGAFFSYLAGVRSIQVGRRQASWSARRRQMAAGWRFFGLSFLLIALIVAVSVFAVDKLSIRQAPAASPTWTETKVPLETLTQTPAPTDSPAPTDTPVSPPTLAQTPTETLVPSRTSNPTQTRWLTLTPSGTPSKIAAHSYSVNASHGYAHASTH